MNIEDILQCKGCHMKQFIGDNSLEILYSRLEKEYINLCFDVVKGYCKSHEEYMSRCLQLETISNILQQIKDIDIRKV